MKKIISIIILLLGIILISCEKEDEYLPPNFNYPIPQVDITEDAWVGAFYYNYSPADWAKGYTYSPILEEYSATDLQTISQHRQWADEGGIDFFIFHWDGINDENLLNSFASGRSENVKMVIDYNVSHLKATNSSPLEGQKLITMVNELKYLSSNYLVKDYYFKIDNLHPVILIRPINLSSTNSSSIDFTVLIPTLRSELQSVGIDPYIIGEIVGGWLPPQRYSKACKTFDGIVLSDWKAEGNYGYDRSVFFPAYTDQAFENWNDSTTTWGIDFIPSIMPGFDDKKMLPSSKIYNIARSTDLYTAMCNVAKRNLGPKRIITINSWNNFQVGTSIEPTEEYKEDYLNITKQQFKVQ